MQGTIFNIQRASVHDGPGLRTTVFLKGCGLRCFWCHNPESLTSRPQLMLVPAKCIGDGACLDVCPLGLRTPQTGPFDFDRSACAGCGACAEVCFTGAAELVGKRVTADDLFAVCVQDQPFYGNGGGVTFSGGEPLLQVELVAEVEKRLRAAGISTAVDTALFAPWEAVEAVLPFTDLFLVDCKAADPELHRRGTGQTNGLILENLRRLSALGARFWLRTPLIPGFNDSPEELRAIGALAGSLPNPPERHELLAFHALCSGKYRALGMPFPAEGIVPPSGEDMARARAYLEEGRAHAQGN